MPIMLPHLHNNQNADDDDDDDDDDYDDDDDDDKCINTQTCPCNILRYFMAVKM